jgi:lipoprotein NlpD
VVFRPLSALLFAALVLQLGACSFNRTPNRAPVEDRGGSLPRPERLAPGAENAGKPGYYTVKPGDTLNRIALETGQSPRDIARWSAVGNPNVLEVGQVLRVTPPETVATVRPVTPPSVLTPSATPPLAGASAPATSVPPVATTSPETPAAASNDDDVPWLWPSGGNIIASFDEVKNKGLDFAGAAGDPVLAAADGRVVYAGAGLRGYGNLVILKHNNTYLTAYAHNQTLLVKEDQNVRRGQKIAEMGNSDADRVKLHFEVRRQGKPVDPAKYLPGR